MKSLWSLTWALCLATAASAEQLIRSSALLTCMENSQFTASSFDVVFYRSNNSVSFEISAISTLSGMYTAKLNVIAYGFSVVTETLNLCDISKQLCPMTPGHFTVPMSSETIGESVIKNVPGVAFTIPDLDGVVRVYVYNQDDPNTPVACVEATLSNDKTVSTKYASWPIAAVCFAGLFTAGIVWLFGHVSTSAHIASSVVSLFCYFQGVAIICMMAVDKLPPVAAAWGQNFMWTVGFISVPFMQDIFNWYIQATGGTSTNILPNASVMSISVQKVKRALVDSATDIFAKYLSPISPTANPVSPYAYGPGLAIPRDVAYFMSHKALTTTTALVARAAGNDTLSPTETTDETLDDFSSTTLVLRGMQRVAFLANIEITSLFLTGLTFFLIFCVFATILFVLAKLILELLVKMGTVQQSSFMHFRSKWRNVIKGVLYRIALLCFPQLTVICLWELTKNDSPGAMALAIFSYITVLALLGFGAYKTFSLARRSMHLHKNPAYILYSDPDALNRWGFLYVQFRATAFYYIIPLLIYLLIKCAFIALIQSAGKVQAVLVFIVELVYLAFISWKKPYMDKATNVFNISIAAINFINALFFLFFSSIFGLPPYVSGVMGVVFFILNAVFSLVLLIMIIVSCVWAVFAKNPETRYQPMSDDRESFIPTAGAEKNAATELDALGASARDGYHPSSQDLYGAPGTLRDDDESFYSTSKDSLKLHDTTVNSSTSAFPNERLTRGNQEPGQYGAPTADLGTYTEYNKSTSSGFRTQAYTGYAPPPTEDPFAHPADSQWRR